MYKMADTFTLPDNCDYCHVHLNGKEIVVIDDYKLYHPACFCKFKNKSLLHNIFETQTEFQKSLGIVMRDEATQKPNQQYVNVMILACMSELDEILMETPWKPWKKQQEYNEKNFKRELVDLFHFFINLCLAAGMTADELYNIYYSKMDENKCRQRRGY